MANNIESLSFRLSTDTIIKSNSFVTIQRDEINNTSDGLPCSTGVCDLNMGTIDKKTRCSTCGNTRKKCLGHRGHIELVTEYITPNAMQETIQWLKIICHDCGAIIVDKEKLKIKTISAATQILTETNVCTQCNTNHPKIIKDDEDSFTIWAESKDEDKKRIKLYPHLIKQIFSKITPDTLSFFGKNDITSPLNFICKNLPVLPNTLRYPISNFLGTGNTHHQFTNTYYQITKRNLLLSNLNDAVFDNMTDGLINKEMDLSLQLLHQLIYDTILGSSAGNTDKRQISSGNKPIQSILRMLPSKKGIIRDNLLGKRVVYTARSTISGNCALKLNEVAVPLEIARALKVEEIVQSYNYEYCMKFFLNGQIYPGCTLIKRKGMTECNDITHIKDKYLNIGDTIYRDLVDKDITLFNRQPTLKPSSMGGHYSRILYDPTIHTLQINVLICKNYQADFDGDQMNIFVPRSVAARAELEILAGVHTHYISDGNSKPLNGQDLDSIVGLFDLTRSFTKMDKYHAMKLIGKCDDRMYTGYDIISSMLESTPINFKKKPSINKDIYKCLNIDEDDKQVVIVNGKMISGVLDEASVGRKSGNIFHIISQEYGKKVALDKIHEFQQIALKYMMFNGFTMSVSDILLPMETRRQIDVVIRNILTDSYSINDNLDNQLLIPPIGMTIGQYYEKLQINALKPSDGEIIDYVLKKMNMTTNGFLKMVGTGSKGSDANFLNICAAVGQQTIDEIRIQKNYCYDRVMAHCPRSALDAEYFGYCSNSYITGSNLIQFLNQAKSMRFSIIAKSMLTAVTGTFLRKGVMNNQNSIVDNNHRVTKDFKVVQYLYGEDGFNPKNLEEVTIKTIMMNDAQLLEYSGEHYELLKKDRDEFRKINMNFESTVINLDFNAKVMVVINVRRYIETIELTPVDEREAAKNYKTLLEFCENLHKIHFNNTYNGQYGELYKASVWVYTVLIRSELVPSVLKMMTEQQLKVILDKIIIVMKRSLIDSGTAVGILASQFICEPLTQGMLSSSHKSASGGSTRSGLIRFDEIYKLKKIEDELSSSMHIPVNVETEADARKIASSIEYITLRTFVRDCKIIVEPFGELRYNETISDNEWLNTSFVKKTSDITSYCIRFTIDKSMLILKNVSMELIIEKLNRISGIVVVSTPETVNNIVIRIWLKSNIRKSNTMITEEFIKDFKNILLDTSIRGADRVIRTEVVKKKRTYIDDNGNVVQKDKFVIVTSGSNLYSVSTHNSIIKEEFNTNSILDTYNTLGIVAARNKIITETSLFLGENASYRHFQIYADEMTRGGIITSLERNGLALREPNNILLRMAYGSPIEVLQRAAINGVKSKLHGPAAMHMMGLTPRVGTNYNTLILNEKFVNENVESVTSIIEEL